MSAKQFRQNRARLIQKIYEVDPLICPKCLGDMDIVAFIDQGPVIEKILRASSFGMPTTMSRQASRLKLQPN